MVATITTAFIGLGGVILGAVAALLSPALTDRRQVRAEERRWRRDQLATAYEQALRYLLRAANRRSEFEGGRGGAVLNREHQREWFDDLVEAQVWLRTVTRYCDAVQVDRIRRTAVHLDRHVSRLVSGERFDRKDFSIWRVLQSCITTVTECARVGEENSIPELSERDGSVRDVLGRQDVKNTVMGDVEQAARRDEQSGDEDQTDGEPRIVSRRQPLQYADPSQREGRVGDRLASEVPPSNIRMSAGQARGETPQTS